MSCLISHVIVINYVITLIYLTVLYLPKRKDLHNYLFETEQKWESYASLSESEYIITSEKLKRLIRRTQALDLLGLRRRDR